MAGWNVDNNSIKKGDFGASGGFHMYSNGYTTTDASTEIKYFGASENLNWALGIGNNFGVTTNGIVYASGIRIINAKAQDGSSIPSSNEV
jgi:hypothetical protein